MNVKIDLNYTLFFGLTLLFAILKLVGYINWSWWIVFIPIYVAVILTLILLIWFHKINKRW